MNRLWRLLHRLLGLLVLRMLLMLRVLGVLGVLLMRQKNSRCRCHGLVMGGSLGMLGVRRRLLHLVLTPIVYRLLVRNRREGVHWSSVDVMLWRTDGRWRV